MALQITWFIFWGLLWAVYFMLDGFDFGSVMLRNFLARDEVDRRMMLTSIGPVWDGNEVWLITAGGATFAAFPVVYASMFSFLYLPMLFVLFSLIARGVAVEYRNKNENSRWRATWDWVMAIASLLASLLFGIAFGNIFRGLPIDATGYRGTFGELFNFYGLWTGLFFALLFLQHGALWLSLKCEGEAAKRAKAFAHRLWYGVLLVAVVFLVATPFATHLYDNYLNHPAWIIVPLLAVASLVAIKVLLPRGDREASQAQQRATFFASCALILLVVATGLVGLYPNLIPSRLDAAQSLTIFNSSSGNYTLRVMTIVVVIFLPIVIAYQILVYRFFRSRVTRKESVEGAEGY